MQTVQEAWLLSGIPATTIRDIYFKLKSLKRPMKALLKANYSEIKKRVRVAVYVLHSEQLLALNDPLEDNLARERRVTYICS